VQKIKFVGVVVFEKKRFEAIVGGNAYERPWHMDRRRNFVFLKIHTANRFIYLLSNTENGIRKYYILLEI
jgi:hypothetical protein